MPNMPSDMEQLKNARDFAEDKLSKITSKLNEYRQAVHKLEQAMTQWKCCYEENDRKLAELDGRFKKVESKRTSKNQHKKKDQEMELTKALKAMGADKIKELIKVAQGELTKL